MMTMINEVLDPRGSDDKARYVVKNLHDTEKNMADLRFVFQGYMRNQDRIRRKSLKLALSLKNFADLETPQLANLLSGTAEGLVELSKHRKLLRDRIEAKSAEPLKLYQTICRNVMNEVKNRELAIAKGERKQLQLQRAISGMNVTDERRVTQSQLQVENAAQEVIHSSHVLGDQIERFETKKLTDVKACLHEFIYSEMQYHSKALEIYTSIETMLHAVNTAEDLEIIKEKMSRELNPS